FNSPFITLGLGIASIFLEAAQAGLGHFVSQQAPDKFSTSLWLVPTATTSLPSSTLAIVDNASPARHVKLCFIIIAMVMIAVTDTPEASLCISAKGGLSQRPSKEFDSEGDPSDDPYDGEEDGDEDDDEAETDEGNPNDGGGDPDDPSDGAAVEDPKPPPPDPTLEDLLFLILIILNLIGVYHTLWFQRLKRYVIKIIR
ncbi:hypothetical protein H0H92_000410, partial [Tricholoma furcatifolium]